MPFSHSCSCVSRSIWIASSLPLVAMMTKRQLCLHCRWPARRRPCLLSFFPWTVLTSMMLTSFSAAATFCSSLLRMCSLSWSEASSSLVCLLRPRVLVQACHCPTAMPLLRHRLPANQHPEASIHSLLAEVETTRPWLEERIMARRCHSSGLALLTSRAVTTSSFSSSCFLASSSHSCLLRRSAVWRIRRFPCFRPKPKCARIPCLQ
mmetsp:Transcript_10251/g.29221  ORF Transcript_10251/g.29221 Transcript_10251/m.29221 type:complete len:207 (-) Transcript_10251:5962-6582(-)